MNSTHFHEFSHPTWEAAIKLHSTPTMFLSACFTPRLVTQYRCKNKKSPSICNREARFWPRGAFRGRFRSAAQLLQQESRFPGGGCPRRRRAAPSLRGRQLVVEKGEFSSGSGSGKLMNHERNWRPLGETNESVKCEFLCNNKTLKIQDCNPISVVFTICSIYEET